MHHARRSFLRHSLLAGSVLAMHGAGVLTRSAHAQASGSSPGGTPSGGAPLRILVLGGTAFLGPQVVEAARKRGHQVTLFNRGRTRPELFPDLEKLQGDRDPNKGEGLKALEGRSWDVVIDNCGYYPRMVKASAELAASWAKQYIFISSISAYAQADKPGQDETAALGTMEDPTLETMGPSFEYYGPLKVLCEQAAEAAMPGRATIIRPGFIVGPEDWTGRYSYWPSRVAEGGEMIAPGDGSDPVQIIDVRDLGEWVIHCAEQRVVGAFNACGPAEALSTRAMIDACIEASGMSPTLTWIPADFLTEQGVALGGDLPIWLPASGETAGFHTWSNARAVKAGLKFRPVVQTSRDILQWLKALPEEEKKRLRPAGMSRERENEVLAAWHEKKAGG